MKIIYDTDKQTYFVKVEYPETDLLICTYDIAEARSEFISYMTRLFNDTVCHQFASDYDENCEAKCDHEWELCGISSAGMHYICKKCGEHKTRPFVHTTSSTH